jgi:ligand-binding sensor domain-containing protein
VWAVTYTRGIYRLDGTAWTHYALPSSLPSNKVTRVAVDPDDAVWVETGPDRYEQGGGVWRFDGLTWEAMADDAWPSDSSTSTTPGSAAWTITDDGVSHFDGGRWTTYTSQNGLINDKISDIAVDPGGTVWVATNGGLSRFVPSAE